MPEGREAMLHDVLASRSGLATTQRGETRSVTREGTRA